MYSIQSTVGRKLTWAAAAGVVAVLLPLGRAGAQAQRVPPRHAAPVSILKADGAVPDLDLRTVKRGFNLFGSGDAALSGMRTTGNLGAGLNNYGFCSNGFAWYACQSELRVYNPGVTNRAPFFDVEWVFAAPPSAYVKIKQVAPSISNALGGGWTAGTPFEVIGGYPFRFGPADGTLGRMFSGVSSTDDGSCRDHTGTQANGDWGNVGISLLPGSNCTDTWGSDGWTGAHPIDQAGYKALFDVQGDNFRWDYWRVPLDNQRTDKPFLGTRFTTYGETTDHASNILPGYGSVVPNGTGAPSSNGYPLGIKLHFEAFNFGVPTVNDAYFAQVMIINRSEDVWGQGIDYDSLYFGFSVGTLFSTQNVSRYAAPELGLVMYHNPNVQGAGGPCDDAYRRPEGSNCGGNTDALRGYGASGLAIIFLASPLGDLRNKLFTRTVSGQPCQVGVDPFCRPGHPNAGDTLTFNHQGFGDYNTALVMAWDRGPKAAFGYLSGNEGLMLDGRDPAALGDRDLWRSFRSEDWPGSSTLVGPSNKAHFNKYVPPGGWDYNHDGILDTLALATCGRYGCAAMDSDTMPGGFVNRRGNVGGHQTFGPFALAAGDTTQLIVAFVGGGDSTEVWSQVRAVEDLYLTFYLAPDAPPPVQVVSTQVTPGSDDLGTADPVVNIFYSDAPEKWVDPFLTKTAEDIRNAPAGTYYGDLNALNPWLADSLTALSRNNLRRLEIYKSCDGGGSWTSTNNCAGNPTGASDTTTSGFGWRPYAVMDVDGNKGDIPNVFEDGNVDGGKTYLYAFVGRSRGATLLVQSDTLGTPANVSFEPAISNSLSRSTNDPNVVSVYVPVSRPAGYRAARVDTTTVPTSTVTFALTLSDNVDSASYRAVFGSEIVVQRDSLTAGSGVRSFVTIERRETVDDAGAGVDSIIRRETFTYTDPLPFLVTADPGAVEDLGTAPLAGDTVRVTTRYGRTDPDTGLAFVLAKADGTPLFGSTQLTADKSTPAALFSRAEYPGFTLNANNADAGTYNGNRASQFRGPQTRAELGLTDADTIVPSARVNANMVQWLSPSSTKTAYGTGNYSVAWGDDPFGVARGFAINLQNPAATEADVQATLNARKVMATGLTDQATADLLAIPQTDLVPVKLPFTIRNTTFGRDVSVAMERRVRNRIDLGTLTDTISVEVPDDVWVPGDVLHFLEMVTEDSTVGGRLVMDSPTQPHRWTHTVPTFSAAVLGCNTPRASCNPIVQGTRGATGYEPMRAGDSTRFGYYVGFTPTTEYAFSVRSAVSGDQITAVTDSTLRMVTVVPNPFVIYSTYQADIITSRLAFTHLPSRGTLRIYTVAAQLVQEIRWEPADLQGDGDLFWNLHSREGIDIASGLYIWVLIAPTNPNDPTSTPLRARGKFVVIRGDAQ